MINTILFRLLLLFRVCLLQIFINIYDIEILRKIVVLYPVYQWFSKQKINNLELFHKSNNYLLCHVIVVYF